MKKIILTSFILLVFNYSFSQTVDKSNSFDNGAIISMNENAKEFNLCDIENLLLIKGIYVKDMDRSELVDPLAVADIVQVKHALMDDAIVSTGIAQVKYNVENGLINKGDFITLSSQPGIGAKAIKSGIIVGIAIEDANPKNSAGLIKARVMIQYIKL